MTKKYLFIVGLALLLPSILLGRSIISSEARMISDIAELFRKYRMYVVDEPIESWDQIAQGNLKLYLSYSHVFEGNITELYSFIPLEDRSKFPDGELILIRYRAKPYTESLKDKDDFLDPRKLTSDTLYKPLRYLIYRDSKGELHRVGWNEEDVQKMLEETKIQIPPPIKFKGYILDKKSQDLLEKNTAIEEASSHTTPIDETPMKVTPVEDSSEPIENSSQWWLWLMGSLMVIVTLALVYRLKVQSKE